MENPMPRAVPDYRIDSLQPKRVRYALVIPVINEGERIRNQLLRVANAGLEVDVIVADGGSTDGSLDLAFLQTAGVTALLTKTSAGKLSAQLRMAYAWCLDQGYEGIVTIDGNGKDNVEAVRLFVERLDAGFDYVQGSRYAKGGVAENTPLERTIGNRLIHAPLLSWAAGYWFTDTTNGFRAYSSRYLNDGRVQPFRDIFVNYELLFYLTTRASQLGMKVCQVPVQRSYPRGEPVPTKVSGNAAKFNMLRQTFDVAIGRYHPPEVEGKGSNVIKHSLLGIGTLIVVVAAFAFL